MKLAKVLSKRIRSLRAAAGLSQQEVATRGDLSLSLVAKLEQAKKADPRASTLLALAHALGVRPGELLDDLFSQQEEPSTNGHHELVMATVEANGVEVEANDEKPAKKKKPKIAKPTKKKKKK